MVLEKTLESPLDCKEIQPVHSKGAEPAGKPDVSCSLLTNFSPINISTENSFVKRGFNVFGVCVQDGWMSCWMGNGKSWAKTVL